MAAYGHRSVSRIGSGGSGRTIIRLTDALVAEEERLSVISIGRIVAEVPGYHGLGSDKALTTDMQAHAREHMCRLVEWLQTDDRLATDYFTFQRPRSTERATRVSFADYSQSFLIGQSVLWAAIRELAPGRASAATAVDLFSRVTNYYRVAMLAGAAAFRCYESAPSGSSASPVEPVLGRPAPAEEIASVVQQLASARRTLDR